MRGLPASFSIMVVTTLVHRSYTMLLVRARFKSWVREVKMRCSRDGISRIGCRAILRSMALSWPRWSPYGDMDVDSRHTLYPCISSYVCIRPSIGGMFRSGMLCSNARVASETSDGSMVTLPSRRSLVLLLVPCGP
jgi:hypothetical protein